MLQYIISCYIVAYHVISYHIVSDDCISNHIAGLRAGPLRGARREDPMYVQRQALYGYNLI